MKLDVRSPLDLGATGPLELTARGPLARWKRLIGAQLNWLLRTWNFSLAILAF